MNSSGSSATSEVLTAADLSNVSVDKTNSVKTASDASFNKTSSIMEESGAAGASPSKSDSITEELTSDKGSYLCYPGVKVI